MLTINNGTQEIQLISLSLINSVFVDAMVSDNNDDVKNKLDELEKKIDKLLEEKVDKTCKDK